MAAVINQIIRIGGTTAHEVEMTEAQVAAYYITGPTVICSHVALFNKQVIGFQAVDHNPTLANGWGDIGTFVGQGLQRRGVGRALFDATLSDLRAAGITTINATIRADNAPGLGYYSRRGFVDHAQVPDFALSDGSVVGRVLKRFDVYSAQFD